MDRSELPELDPRVRATLEEAGQEQVTPSLPDDWWQTAATVAAELGTQAPPRGGVGMVLGASVIARLLSPGPRAESTTAQNRIDRRG